MDSKIANIDYSILIFILYSFDKFKLTCIKHKESEKKKRIGNWYNALHDDENHFANNNDNSGTSATAKDECQTVRST